MFDDPRTWFPPASLRRPQSDPSERHAAGDRSSRWRRSARRCASRSQAPAIRGGKPATGGEATAARGRATRSDERSRYRGARPTRRLATEEIGADGASGRLRAQQHLSPFERDDGTAETPSHGFRRCRPDRRRRFRTRAAIMRRDRPRLQNAGQLRPGRRAQRIAWFAANRIIHRDREPAMPGAVGVEDAADTAGDDGRRRRPAPSRHGRRGAQLRHAPLRWTPAPCPRTRSGSVRRPCHGSSSAPRDRAWRDLIRPARFRSRALRTSKARRAPACARWRETQSSETPSSSCRFSRSPLVLSVIVRLGHLDHGAARLAAAARAARPFRTSGTRSDASSSVASTRATGRERK
ncbi:hypothetical protein SAMN05444336_10898 [Albimonas donghaensis]|uniref:Uncharacterized protein n=1 Tax=Albimonas donghaensis TaxID=356660 RepID=A0A1H3DQ25_9RHOB|nr:hypothetical protein SAMN05444336_10898 [Albimonas donghaensis]